MLVHRRVTPSSKFAGTHLYTWVERGTMGVKCLAQEHNAVPRPGLEPGPSDPESSALTIRPPVTGASVKQRSCFRIFSVTLTNSWNTERAVTTIAVSPKVMLKLVILKWEIHNVRLKNWETFQHSWNSHPKQLPALFPFMTSVQNHVKCALTHLS